MPIVVRGRRSRGDLAVFATLMAARNLSGFRQPGRRPGSTSLVERLAIAAGQLEPEPTYRPSARGDRKRKRRAETRTKIREQYAREAERRAHEAEILRHALFG